MRESQSERLNRQGNEHFARGHYTEAYACYAQALECDRVSGDRRALAATLGNLGNICRTGVTGGGLCMSEAPTPVPPWDITRWQLC